MYSFLQYALLALLLLMFYFLSTLSEEIRPPSERRTPSETFRPASERNRPPSERIRPPSEGVFPTTEGARPPTEGSRSHTAGRGIPDRAPGAGLRRSHSAFNLSQVPLTHVILLHMTSNYTLPWSSTHCHWPFFAVFCLADDACHFTLAELAHRKPQKRYTTNFHDMFFRETQISCLPRAPLYYHYKSAMPSWERALYTPSVKRPQPHNTNPQKERREWKNRRRK